MDLFGRLQSLLEVNNLPSLFVAGAVLLVVFMYFVKGQGLKLASFYFFLLMLSGSYIEIVDTGSTLMRWAIMLLIGAMGLFGARSPGIGAFMLAGYGIWGLALLPVSSRFMLSLQLLGLLLVITLPVAGRIAYHLRSRMDIRRFLNTLLVCVIFFIVSGTIAVLFLGLDGERFGGASKSAPLFVLTGGILLNLTLWFTLYHQKHSRLTLLYGVFCTLGILFLCALSAQRTGIFAGIIGCLPLLTKLRGRRLYITLGIGMVLVGMIYTINTLSPDHATFMKKRFLSTSLTGREERWERALNYCLERPILGYGPGSSNTRIFGFHNAFLVAWHDGGLVGLLFFLGAFLVIGYQALWLIWYEPDEEINGYARLILGWILTLTSGAFFETKLLSPSNIAIFTTILASVLITRIYQIRRQEARWREEAAEVAWTAPPGPMRPPQLAFPRLGQ